ncbi:hypothetical protein [Sandaracinus amylolyticus]|uniref:Basic proline-rich protein n=1 Tax=Sandaracinus amylolyticus TaxID=927083 RepID=A0A0F6SFC3_9BACT|nr:hypothetical protein [Sandaracinus amylolyticus]AKF06694.1 Basic proline-rich protein [Sandaracinus amylolyticus]
MNDLLGVTIDDLVASLKSRRIRIPSDIGAFVALETVEALLRGPAIVRGGDVRIAEDGTVSVFAPPNSASAEEAARSVIALLATLLVASGTGVPPVLVGLVEHGAGSGPAALERLRDELEASLVPLNRGASRRVLSRMIREARRAASQAESALDEVPEDQLDDALDDLIGAPAKKPAAPAGARGMSDPDLAAPAFSAPPADLSDPFADPEKDPHPLSVTPPPGAVISPIPRVRHEAPSDAITLDEPRPELAAIAAPKRTTPKEIAKPAPRVREPAPEPAPAIESERPPKPRAKAPPSFDEFEAAPKSTGRGGGLIWGLAFVVVILFAIAGVALMRPDLVDVALGRPPAPEAPAGPTPEEQEAALRAHRARFGTLTVRSTPDRAQVLMFVGRGPAMATQLPTGMAYELVAIADGRAPTRAIVPADAQWERTADGPRYELAMQTGDQAMPPDRMVLGDTRLPRDALGAPGPELGSIRVVTNPPGAKVYLLVGFTPQVTVQNVRTDEVVELLVYREGHALERVPVMPSDWREGEDGTKTADVEVTLRPLAPQRGR